MVAGAALDLEQWFSSWRSGWRSLILALLAGLALPLAFAPINLFPLAIISPALMFWLWAKGAPREAFISGYVFGLGYFGLGVSWVAVSMYRFGGMGLVLSAITTLLFILFLSLFPAMLGWLARRYFRDLSRTYYVLLLLPALWVLLEWVRGWIFTGFPWLLLGYSQLDAPLAGLAPLLGVYGVSWAVALSAALLLWVWLASGQSRFTGLVAVLLLWIGAASLSAIDWSESSGRPLRVSLIQGNVPQELKWRPEQRAPTVDLYTRLSRERWDSDIVLWPETALPFFFHQAEVFLQSLAFEAGAAGHATLLAGLPVMPDRDTGLYYNSVVRVGDPSMDENSQIYSKSHLVPFGEYIPFKTLLGNFLDILQVPMSSFSPGPDQQELLEVAGHRIGVSICYEDAFGEEVIRALPEAAFLVNVSNDAWFGDSLAPHQHLQMARMRSLETSRPMLRATNNGVSAIINQNGLVMAASPQFEVAVLDGTIQPRSGATPYVLTGNVLIVSVMILLLGVCIYLQNKVRPGEE